MRSVLETRSDWLANLLSTEPADRPRAEAALRDLYVASGFPPPVHFFGSIRPLRQHGPPRC
jgi:hypothetical protein